MDHRPRSGVWKGSSGGEVICFSGCDDDEAYNNTTALGNMTSIGAMTICFIQAIVKLDLRATYGNILNEMRTTIRNSGRVSGISSGQVSLALTVAGILVSGGSDCGIIGSRVNISCLRFTISCL
ncbi:Caspase domain [Sesbania bispinosa]|nr:Caspase domain [Sesbania bispinosa]